MSVDPEDQFIEKITETVKANGYPEKKVSLPLDKVQSAAESRGLELDMILSRLGMMGVHGGVKGDKIFFSDAVEEESASAANPFANIGGGMGGMGDMLGGLDLDSLKNISQEDLMGQVTNMMQNMTPEQQESMMDMYKNMSDEEREEIMNKGKDMGFM